MNSQLPLLSGQNSHPPQRSCYQTHLQPPPSIFFPPPFRHFSRLRSLIILPLFQPGLQPGKNKPAGLAKAKQRQPNYWLPHCSFGPAGALPPLSPLPLAASEQLPLTPRHAAGQNEVFALKMLVPRARTRQRRRVPAEGTPARSPGLEASPRFCTWDVIILSFLTALNSTLRQMTYQQRGIYLITLTLLVLAVVSQVGFSCGTSRWAHVRVWGVGHQLPAHPCSPEQEVNVLQQRCLGMHSGCTSSLGGSN